MPERYPSFYEGPHDITKLAMPKEYKEYRFDQPVSEVEYQEWERLYIPPPYVKKDDLILDCGARAGDSAVFFFEHEYTNLRLIEPWDRDGIIFDLLRKNVEILRSKGCTIDLRLEIFKPEHLEGVKYLKMDAEGAEQEVDFSKLQIPYVVAIHENVTRMSSGVYSGTERALEKKD